MRVRNKGQSRTALELKTTVIVRLWERHGGRE